MTKEFSPAAQAVLDAAEAGLDGYIELLPPTWKSGVASALRAAVAQVNPEKILPEILYSDDDYLDGYKDALFEILIIANELQLTTVVDSEENPSLLAKDHLIP